jgi:release factor glutamine methyltransferase
MTDTKKEFHNSLKAYYPKVEIDSMFMLVLQHVTGMNRNQILLYPGIELSNRQEKVVLEILNRLSKQEPLQYILGETEFYGLPFKLNKAVLIPRSETEELVGLIVHEYAQKAIKLLDIGTGSACIPVSLKKNMPYAEIYSCDISAAAIETAKENALLNNVDVSFFLHDILSDKALPFAPFDVIVSNPPYVTENEKNQMQKHVLDYEPHTALFVPDDDPLVYYNAIVEHSATSLKRGGALFFEINEAFGSEIESLLTTNNFEAKIFSDIHGKSRLARGLKA